jgi:hypothetical protein
MFGHLRLLGRYSAGFVLYMGKYIYLAEKANEPGSNS